MDLLKTEMNKIKKAVLPVAGFGTRFLPASKAIPKEMLPIIDKPLVQYAVEEAIEIGIEEIIFITSPSKYSIKKHFDFNQAIDNKLRNSGKDNLAELANPGIFHEIDFKYINQDEHNLQHYQNQINSVFQENQESTKSA